MNRYIPRRERPQALAAAWRGSPVSQWIQRGRKLTHPAAVPEVHAAAADGSEGGRADGGVRVPRDDRGVWVHQDFWGLRANRGLAIVPPAFEIRMMGVMRKGNGNHFFTNKASDAVKPCR